MQVHCLTIAVAAFLVRGGCGDDGAETTARDGAVLGPLTLTAAQLDEFSPSPDVVGALMGAAEVEDEPNAFGIPVEVPPTAAIAGRDYWSMDTEGRAIGVGPVDLVSVQLVLVENDDGVLPVIDAGLSGQ